MAQVSRVAGAAGSAAGADAEASLLPLVSPATFASSGLFVTVDAGAGDGFAGAVVAGGEISVVAGVGCGVSGSFCAHPAATNITVKTIATTRIS